MSDNEIKFLPYEQAVALVAAIQEEEDIHRENRCIFTVYNHDNQEVCWYDFDEVMAEVGVVPKEEVKVAVQHYILHHLPDWAADI